jgi:ribosomal protein S18 acetylase RimI-like enzyme
MIGEKIFLRMSIPVENRPRLWSGKVVMEIVTARTEDIEELAGLLGHLFAQEAEFQPDIDIQRRGIWMVLQNPANGTIWVARNQQRIVGMVMVLYTVSTALGGRVGILEDLVVLPEFRNQGIGTRLVRHAAEHARQMGLLRLTLLTDGDNILSQQLYQKLGWTRSEMVPMRLLTPVH